MQNCELFFFAQDPNKYSFTRRASPPLEARTELRGMKAKVCTWIWNCYPNELLYASLETLHNKQSKVVNLSRKFKNGPCSVVRKKVRTFNAQLLEAFEWCVLVGRCDLDLIGSFTCDSGTTVLRDEHAPNCVCCHVDRIVGFVRR